ncbi:ROK family protein [Microbacterium oxydans]|nr:ROK family protein [Microbacterium oxydans]
MHRFRRHRDQDRPHRRQPCRRLRSIPVEEHPTDLDKAAAHARALLDQTGRAADAVGIAVPGVVDPRSDRMLHANAKYDFLEDIDLHAWAHTEFDLPSVVENDARAALIGETSSGSAAGERDAVLVTLGTGIGTAAMIDGSPLRGRTGHAGILGGHLTVDIDGPTCPCGNIGCGEALASTRALPEHVSMTQVFTTNAHPDLRDRFLHVWGAVVTSLVHSLRPRRRDPLRRHPARGDAVSAPIEDFVREHLWPSLTPPHFVVPPEPELSVVRGLSTLIHHPHRHHPHRHPAGGTVTTPISDMHEGHTTRGRYDTQPTVALPAGGAHPPRRARLDGGGRARRSLRPGDRHRPVLLIDTYPGWTSRPSPPGAPVAAGWAVVDVEATARPVAEVEQLIAPSLTDDRASSVS